MRRILLTAGAALLLAAPALGEEVTIEKKTITREVPSSGSTVSTTIIAPNPPPAPQAETPPPPPGPTMVWTPGHWSWEPERHAYNWIHGKFMEPPHARAAWVPGRWAERPDGWYWQEGRWD